jgi:hypothetical protein
LRNVGICWKDLVSWFILKREGSPVYASIDACKFLLVYYLFKSSQFMGHRVSIHIPKTQNQVPAVIKQFY